MKMMKNGPKRTLGRKQGEGHSPGLKERKKLYRSHRWRKLREIHLEEQPLCVGCYRQGRIVAAEIVDHKLGHGPGWQERFFDPETLQSLCWSCHSKKTQRERRGGPVKKRQAQRPIPRSPLRTARNPLDKEST